MGLFPYLGLWLTMLRCCEVDKERLMGGVMFCNQFRPARRLGSRILSLRRRHRFYPMVLGMFWILPTPNRNRLPRKNVARTIAKDVPPKQANGLIDVCTRSYWKCVQTNLGREET